MKTLCTILFIFLFSLSLNAQSSSQEKREAIARSFVEAYNAANYSKMRTDFSGIMKIILTKKKLKQSFGPTYASMGKARMLSPEFPTKSRVIIPLVYENDTTETSYLNFSFTEDDKIVGLWPTETNIVYPRIRDTTTIDDIVAPYMSFKHNQGLGMVVGVYNNGEKEIKCYGSTVKGNSTMPDSSTLFQVGSISKVFTCLMLANSVNNNTMFLSSGISRYLPDSIPKLQYKRKEITLLDLATQTSALNRDVDDRDTTGGGEDPYKNYSEEKLMAYLKRQKLAHATGKEYQYSNVGVGLLGVIMQKERRMSYDELLQKEICSKLGMQHTRTVLGKDEKEKVIQSYYKGEPTVDMSFTDALAGAGGIYSNAADMLRFIEASVHPEQTEIEKDILLTEQMWRKASNGQEMGLGWHHMSIDSEGKEVKALVHPGNTNGTSTMLILIPAKKIGVIVMANSNYSVQEIGVHIAKLMMKKNTAAALTSTAGMSK
jgi:CubicO group peptidase (beta-lactamase class C family)